VPTRSRALRHHHGGRRAVPGLRASAIATGLTPATVNKSLAHLERIGSVGNSRTGSVVVCSAIASTSRNLRPNWKRPD